MGGAVRRRGARRTHFVKADLGAALGGLPRGFAACQPAADDRDWFVSHSCQLSYHHNANSSDRLSLPPSLILHWRSVAIKLMSFAASDNLVTRRLSLKRFCYS